MKYDANGFAILNTDNISSLLVTLVLNIGLVWLSFLVSRALWKKDKFGAGLIAFALVGILLLRVFLDVGLVNNLGPHAEPALAQAE